MAGKSNLIVSSRGQITLPSELRKRLGIKGGGVLTIEERPGEVVLKPAAVLEVEMYSEADIAGWDREDRLEPAIRDRLKKKLSRRGRSRRR